MDKSAIRTKVDELVEQLTLEEKASLCSGQDFWHSQAIERLGIPSIMMCDGPNGLRKQTGEGDHMGIRESIRTTCYPTASAMAASFDVEALGKLGTALGKECQAEDVGMLLGPGVNMKRSPLCGRNFEYFSEDPFLAGELAAAYIRALQAEGVSACVKHFAVNNQETRRMSISAQVDERTLHEVYLPAFETAVKKGEARSIMCSYNAMNGTFAAVNKKLLTDILRDEFGFDGMVVTDWGAVKNRVQGLKAGLDLEMPGGRGTNDRSIVEAVQSGSLTEEELNQAVRNILTFVLTSESLKTPDAVIDREACAGLAEELAEQCAVLLKNEHDILPLRQDMKVAFIGEFAIEPRYQGAGSSHINTTAVGAVKFLQDRNCHMQYARGYDVHEQLDASVLMEEAIQTARSSDVAVIFAGLPMTYESEGDDRTSLNLPENQNALIYAVSAVQPNTVVVLHTGSPIVMPWADQVAGILLMYLGGQDVGESTVRLLYGDAVPSGKLAETWPMQLEDNPSYLNFPGEGSTVEYREGIFIGYRYYDKKHMVVRYPFGHGLSYTKFVYSDLHIERRDIQENESVQVTCRVTNVGALAGKEAVQLYVHNCNAEVNRPVRELKGFQKVALKAGESKKITFTLNSRSFAYYEPRISDWFVPSGTYQIEVGASSRDIRLSDQIQVEGLKELPVIYTDQTLMRDLQKSKQGKAFIDQIIQLSSRREKESRSEKSMGEGSQQAIMAMIMDMPLRSLVTFGAINQQQLDELIEQLNS